MANSRFEYVRGFERHDALLPLCWIGVRVDGKGFHRFADSHAFEKPNDARALRVMNDAALAVLEAFPDAVLGFGESDEYSFVLKKVRARAAKDHSACRRRACPRSPSRAHSRRLHARAGGRRMPSQDTTLYGRREAKIVSVITSLFTASYVMAWPRHFGDAPLLSAPVFDGRAVAYPSDAVLRDYLAWRQADTHINNQYNTVFWALVDKGGETPAKAQAMIKVREGAGGRERRRRAAPASAQARPLRAQRSRVWALGAPARARGADARRAWRWRPPRGATQRGRTKRSSSASASTTRSYRL